jgi:hypothetical protein
VPSLLSATALLVLKTQLTGPDRLPSPVGAFHEGAFTDAKGAGQ